VHHGDPYGDRAGLGKAGVLVRRKIHATEVSASSACLYLLNKLATGYGSDPEITRALDTRASTWRLGSIRTARSFTLPETPNMSEAAFAPIPTTKSPSKG